MGRYTRISSSLRNIDINPQHYFDEIKRKNTGLGNAKRHVCSKVWRNSFCGISKKTILLHIRGAKIYKWAVLSSGCSTWLCVKGNKNILRLRKGKESHRLIEKYDGELGLEILFHLVYFSEILGLEFYNVQAYDIPFILWRFCGTAPRRIEMFRLTCVTLRFWQQPGIILLKEGTDSSQGVPQLISNINACQFIADAVRTTLGPRGMDKLIVNNQGKVLYSTKNLVYKNTWTDFCFVSYLVFLLGKATISNDGATIISLLDVVHPAAKTLVDISKSQDAEVCKLWKFDINFCDIEDKLSLHTCVA